MKSARLFNTQILALLLTLSAPVIAEEASDGLSRGGFRVETAVPPDDDLLRYGAVIGEIYIETHNIFDPSREGEDRLLYNLANRLHKTTNHKVIERKLLFESGDPYDPRVLRETARYLRSQDYLFDAEIQPIRYRGNRVDILVSTRDVWTLSVGAGLARSGGANTFQINIEESNFLGTGRQLDLKYSDDPDRSSRRFRFVDTALFGSRTELRLWYSANSDGHRRIFDLERPFYALDTRWGAGTKLVSEDRQEKLYSQGEVTERFQHERTMAEIRGGRSRGLIDGRASRWFVGYTYQEDRFRSNDQTSEGFVLPVARTLSYPWIGFETVEDEYLVTQNLDQLARPEDLNLGTELRGRLGWSSGAWGGDKDQAIFSLEVRSGWTSQNDQTLLLSGHAAGRWGTDGHENVTLGGEVRYFLRTFGRHRLQVALRLDAAWNLDPERQLLLGGDNGLRGYPRRFQDGDRRFLLSLEHRFYTDWELFNLVNAGAAVFVDAGRAWYDDVGGGHGVLKDIGFGLRLSSSRSSKGTMVHLDVAYPLDGDTDKVQWLVTTRESF
ncbi:MAG: hypothetical protein AAF560_15710 [Acidobacteriota bacterium]